MRWRGPQCFSPSSVAYNCVCVQEFDKLTTKLYREARQDFEKETAMRIKAEKNERVRKRQYWVISGLFLMLGISIISSFATSLAASELAKDTEISAEGGFIDKKTGKPLSTENPHFTTKAADQARARALQANTIVVLHSLRSVAEASHPAKPVRAVPAAARGGWAL